MENPVEKGSIPSAYPREQERFSGLHYFCDAAPAAPLYGVEVQCREIFRCASEADRVLRLAHTGMDYITAFHRAWPRDTQERCTC